MDVYHIFAMPIKQITGGLVYCIAGISKVVAGFCVWSCMTENA